jgi:MFS family permease
MASNGLGALIGGLSLASFGRHFTRRRLIYTGLFGCCGFLLLFAISRHFWLSCGMLMVAGFFMITFLATANTSVQLRSPDHLRGRIMGFYSLSFLGMSSLGSLVTGALAKYLTAPGAVIVGVVVCVLVALVLWRRVIPVPPEERPVP